MHRLSSFACVTLLSLVVAAALAVAWFSFSEGAATALAEMSTGGAARAATDLAAQPPPTAYALAGAVLLLSTLGLRRIRGQGLHLAPVA